MKVFLLKLWDSVRTSYWFMPTLMAGLSVGLVAVMLGIDRRGDQLIEQIAWLYSGGPEGAREVLATIAASMITVAGVVFSITIVALTLASQQFGPQILYNFMRDRGNQVVLGTFISTFLYCILILRTVHGETEGVEAFVPHVSVTFGVVLAILSLGVLIYYIHHASMAIQAPRVIAAVTLELHHAIRTFRDGFAGRDPSPEEREAITYEVHGGRKTESAPVYCREEGYVQAIDQESLIRLAGEHDLLIRLVVRPGFFVVHGTAVAQIEPADGLADGLPEQVLQSIAIGSRRTALQDLEFSVDQLTEIAVRALSPSINDPFTAADCVEHLGAGIAHLLRTSRPAHQRMDDRGRLRLILERPLTFDGIVNSAFDQIRQHMRGSVSVAIRMLEVMNTLIPLTRTADERRSLERHARMVHAHGMKHIEEEHDRVDLEERFAAVMQQVSVAAEGAE